VPQKLAVIGCGKMAYAILKGLNRQAFAAIYCNDINPARSALFEAEFGATACALCESIDAADMIILAVKPQQLAQVMEDSQGRWTADKLLISVLAGVKTESLEKATGGKTAIIRVMPNTPCLIGQGISALCAGKLTTPVQMLAAQDIFAQLGKVVTVEEKLMDAVTAVSGSGPAYVFSVVEAMINAAVNVGLDAALARELVLATCKGSLAMLEAENAHPAVLREQVCSPAGTTIAGVRQLEANGLRKAFFDAIEKAYQRSIELGKQ
jgi:pyrroline-5-carboxylate reductase